jgi:aspartyl/asparaginyl-tRNA synthetase
MRVEHLNSSLFDQHLLIRARVHNIRGTGKQCFLVLRQQSATVQAVIAVNPATSKQMVKFAINLSKESIVDVGGILKTVNTPIESCTQNMMEIHVETLYIVSPSEPRLPFTIDDASRCEEQIEKEDVFFSRVNLDTRLDHRVIDLRTITNQAIFRIQSGVCELFREFLLKKQFVEIHSPKIISAASEGGASVFKLSYFDRYAYLAQSPQLYKQMVICSDFERVFEIGPVFRAEDSNTHRHMTEFTGLDIEMCFYEHYHEVLELLGDLFVDIFDGIEKRFTRELAVIQRQYPFTPFRCRKPVVRITFQEGIRLLHQHGIEISDCDDLR